MSSKNFHKKISKQVCWICMTFIWWMLWNLFNILPFFHSTDCFAYMRNILATSVIACFCEVPSTQGMQKAGDVIEFDREHTFFTIKYFHRSNNHWTPCKRLISSVCEMIDHFSEVQPYSMWNLFSKKKNFSLFLKSNLKLTLPKL